MPLLAKSLQNCTLGETRTLTNMILNHMPLPIGLPGQYIKAETIPFALGLLSDYVFPSCPDPFEVYPNNADWLDQSLLKLLFWTTHLLLILFNPAGLIHPCGTIDLSKISILACGLYWQWTFHY